MQWQQTKGGQAMDKRVISILVLLSATFALLAGTTAAFAGEGQRQWRAD
jgi:hypothetical protein